MSYILLVPRIQIHNANALSSPYTIGFPSMTAWMGAVHALQRSVQSSGLDDVEGIQFSAVSIISHHMNLHSYQGEGDYIQSLISTGNPLKKDGKKPSFIEEARCDLTISLIIECSDVPGMFEFDELIAFIDKQIASKMKLAGGDIIQSQPCQIIEVYEDEEEGLQQLVRSVMPGYALIERKDLMQTYMAQNGNALDALLQGLTLHYNCTEDENGKVEWGKKGMRNQKGWIVPMSVGFQGLTDPRTAMDQRDETTLHRFAESIVTLGEFKMPHRFDSLDEMLWKTHYYADKNLYLCQPKIDFITD